MRQRDFIALLVGAVVIWPVAARGQQSATPIIGFLSTRWHEEAANLTTAFRQGLGENGYIEGQNVRIQYRWAEGHFERMSDLAADLVRNHVTIIVAVGGTRSALAAKEATKTIPIVFTTGGDPIQLRLVDSFNKPGGNATGVSSLLNLMESKRLALLHELVPRAELIGALLNPTNANVQTQLKEIQDTASAIGQQVRVLNASSQQDLHGIFRTLSQLRAGGLLVSADPFFDGRREQLVTLAAHYAIPAIYQSRDYVMAGGLMSYGANLADAYRQVGVYAGRILKGEKPADLPVAQSTRFELVINLETAKVLGLEIPPTLRARADEVIE